MVSDLKSIDQLKKAMDNFDRIMHGEINLVDGIDSSKSRSPDNSNFEKELHNTDEKLIDRHEMKS